MDKNTITICLSELSAISKAENSIIINRFDDIIKYHSDKLKEFDALLKLKSDASSNSEINSNTLDNYNALIKALKSFYSTIDDSTIWGAINDEFKNYINEVLLQLPDYYKTEKQFKKEFLNSLSFSSKINITVHKIFFYPHRAILRLVKRDPAKANPIGKVYFKYLLKKIVVPAFIDEMNRQIKLLQTILANHYLALFDSSGISSYSNSAIDTSYPDLVAFKNALKADLEKSNAEINTSIEKAYWTSLAKIKSATSIRIKSNKKYNHSFKLMDKLQKSWNTTFYALIEDWRFREYLFKLNTQINSSFLAVKKSYTQRVNEALIPEVNKHISYTNKILNSLPKEDSTLKTVKQFLVKELTKLEKENAENRTFSQAISAANEIPKLLGNLQDEVKEHLGQMQNRVGIVRNPDYANGVKNSDIYYFTPADFIEFDCLPDFRTKIKEQTNALELKLKDIITEFNDYNQIIDFYLDTSISLAEEPGVSEQNVVHVFREGLERLILISNRISESLNNLIAKDLESLFSSVEALKDKILTLDNNNNIVSLYSNVLKSKAIAKSVDNRKRVTTFGVHLFHSVLTRINLTIKRFQDSFIDLRKRLNLDRDTSPISSDLSLYLAESERRLEKLPVIYQYLYANTPIREFNLFISRTSEIELLNKAYNNWISGGYSATTIIGELGSGKSSLLHYFKEKLSTKYKITYFILDEIYSTESDYYKLIAQIFDNPELTDDESIQAYIDNTERKIILIDGLERLFSRTVGGFQSIKKLLALIVSSNHKIFWVTTISLYANDYLTKTIQYPEYFDFIIKLKSMTSDEIQELVLKRHRLSGFNLRFDNPIGEKREGKDEIIIQNQRKNRFFELLIKNAQGNISMALIYWLQSIDWTADSQIIVNDVNIPDFSFLNSFSLEKYYLLLTVILHGKITAIDLAKALKISHAKSANLLTILKEDSVLIKSGAFYSLNGLLYSQVIKQLIYKNLLQ